MGGLFSFLTHVAVAAVQGVASLWQKATKDGHLAAAGRQGLDELGMALKAFPDAIQTQESGAIFNPTQGEIGKARQEAGFTDMAHRYPWPSEIIERYANRQAEGGVHGHGQADQRTPSPSEIVASHKDTYGQAQSGGEQVIAEGKPRPGQSWEDYVNERREKAGGNGEGGYQPGLNRNLPDEEKQRDQGHGRG